ncbi:MAG: DUF3795 domain-containing protein [Bacillota bacterium]|nr:DUF3795 domain-containing protein [Bacillota bacterium]
MLEEKLIAPCGMNCGLCISYQALHHELAKKGFRKKTCVGCLPRSKNCTYMSSHCELMKKGLVRFCYECGQYPCSRLKSIDKRYRTKYHMSMLENLESIKTLGIEAFLAKEEEKWHCQKCGHLICCHSGLCLHCDLDKLRQKKTYSWDD